MKKVIAMMCMAAACTAAAAGAQSGTTMDKDKMKNDKMMKGTVMVTGCVADKDSMGHYMLNNAATSAMPATTTGSSAPMMSYALSGGDLKPHVGHKVEVTGMVEKAKMDKAGEKKMDGKMMMMSDTLKVKSVKMLADTCTP